MKKKNLPQFLLPPCHSYYPCAINIKKYNYTNVLNLIVIIFIDNKYNYKKF